MSYQLVEQLQKKAVPVTQACRVLQVSQSGYYTARMRSRQAPRICADSVHLKAIFAASGRTYGSRRLCSALQKQGVIMGRHRVRTLMRANGLHPVWRRKFVHTTDSRHALAVSPNVLARQFEQSLPDRAWVCDLTYIRTRSGWLYLAAVLDLHSRKIVGWAMAPEMPAALVCAALQMAVAQRNPAKGLLVHSDRGTQGGFNRSSQHRVEQHILGSHSELQPVSSSPTFCVAYRSRWRLQREALVRPTGTGPSPWGSTGAAGRSCSRWCRAARGCADRQRRLSRRTRR